MYLDECIANQRLGVKHESDHTISISSSNHHIVFAIIRDYSYRLSIF